MYLTKYLSKQRRICLLKFCHIYCYLPFVYLYVCCTACVKRWVARRLLFSNHSVAIAVKFIQSVCCGFPIRSLSSAFEISHQVGFSIHSSTFRYNNNNNDNRTTNEAKKKINLLRKKENILHFFCDLQHRVRDDVQLYRHMNSLTFIFHFFVLNKREITMHSFN